MFPLVTNDPPQPTAVVSPQLELATILQAMGSPLPLVRGTILFRQGQEPRSAFVVRTGRIQLSLRCGNGQVAYKSAGPGCVLGLPATVSDQPYSLTAAAAEDSDLVSVDQQRIMDLLRHRSDLLFCVIATLAEELRQMRRQAGVLAGERQARSKHSRQTQLP